VRSLFIGNFFRNLFCNSTENSVSKGPGAFFNSFAFFRFDDLRPIECAEANGYVQLFSQAGYYLSVPVTFRPTSETVVDMNQNNR
jgi:hypothetical protein